MHVSADELVGRLRQDGLRITPPRRAVCEVLAVEHERHLTLAELHDLAAKRLGAPIDQSTVYRTVDALEEHGLVQHVHLGDGPAIVHLSSDQHHHFVCEQCGATVGVPAEAVRAALASIAEPHGFVIDSIHVGIVGTCESCAVNSS